MKRRHKEAGGCVLEFRPSLFFSVLFMIHLVVFSNLFEKMGGRKKYNSNLGGGEERGKFRFKYKN